MKNLFIRTCPNCHGKPAFGEYCEACGNAGWDFRTWVKVTAALLFFAAFLTLLIAQWMGWIDILPPSFKNFG